MDGTFRTRLRTHGKHLFPVLVMLSFAAMHGCKKSGKRDVTNDPHYDNFSSAVGVWRAKVPLFLKELDRRLYLATDSEIESSSDRLLATLPVGTEVRILRLTHETTFEIERTYPTGTLTAGPYAGRDIELDDDFFAPNRFTVRNGSSTQPVKGYTFKWTVASDKLSK